MRMNNTSLSSMQPEPQRLLVLQISQRTGLNVRFAVECLQENGWVMEKALANYEQVKVGTCIASLVAL